VSHAGRGTAWEQLLELHATRYERAGQAVVLRTPPPVKLLKAMPGGRWLAVMTSEGPPDYSMLVGRPAGGPLAVLAEAKNNDSGRWALKQLHPHQAQKLQLWHGLGGLACVILGHQPTRTGYVLPWATLGPVWQRWHAQKLTGRKATSGTASLGEGDLAALGVPWPMGQGYLGALLHCAPVP